MSFPTIPPIIPDIDIDREQVINLILASIGFEELGLAHMINAAAEELQLIVTATPMAPLADILAVERSVEKIMRDVIKKEIIMQFKLEDILTLPTTTTTCCPQCECTLRTEFIGPDYVLGFVNNPNDQFNGRVNALLAEACIDCTCQSTTVVQYLIFNPDVPLIEYSFTALPDTVVVTCPAPGVTAIGGRGKVVRDGVFQVAIADFTLLAIDDAPDSYVININAAGDPAFSHNSGVVNPIPGIGGDIIVEDCSSAAGTPLAILTPEKIEELKKGVIGRVRSMEKK